MMCKLYLAPIRGFTDAVYRNTFSEHFSGIDIAVAPFVTTHQGKRIRPALIRGLLPENNTGMPLIPQILSKDPEGFIRLATRLYDLGYDTVNWNLGCPFPMVANKQRGSGLLPYPDKIDSFLETVLPAIPNVLSVKTRLGRRHGDEIFRVMPVFNRYPLKEIIIHPRVGIQMYEGKPDLETFEACLGLSAHPVVYNGDISSLDSFQGLSLRFPEVSRWMLGRGVLINPLLPEIIRNGQDIFPHKIEIIRQFHDALFQEYGKILCGPSHLLERMKGFWKYFSLAFEESRKIQKKVHKTKKTDRYTQIVSHFFENEARWADVPVSDINEWF